MSEKSFMAYGDAETILTGYANEIKKKPTTFTGTTAQWAALSAAEKAAYEIVNLTDDYNRIDEVTIEDGAERRIGTIKVGNTRYTLFERDIIKQVTYNNHPSLLLVDKNTFPEHGSTHEEVRTRFNLVSLEGVATYKGNPNIGAGDYSFTAGLQSDFYNVNTNSYIAQMSVDEDWPSGDPLRGYPDWGYYIQYCRGCLEVVCNNRMFEDENYRPDDAAFSSLNVYVKIRYYWTDTTE